MPTFPEHPPLKPMTLGDEGAVQLDIDGSPSPLTSLTVNGVEIDPHQVIAPITARLDVGGRAELSMRWLVDEVLMTTADGTRWRLDSAGNFTAAGGVLNTEEGTTDE